MSLTTGIISIIGFILAIYILATTIMYFQQEKFIFFPVKTPSSYTYEQFPNATELFLEAQDGTILHSLHFTCKNPKGIVLYFHGNAGAIDSWGYGAVDFTKNGYDVLMPDYRSYGKSKGKLNYEAMRSDALVFYNYLAEKYPAQKIIIYGISLGSGIASDLATKVEAQQLILATPYTSISDMAKLSMGFFPIDLLLRYPFSNERHLTKVQYPIHIFHGTKDELIPYHQAVKLAQLFPNQDIMTTIPNGMHNNLSEFKIFQDKLSTLLQ